MKLLIFWVLEKKSSEIDKLFKKYDTNNDGEIDFKEFVNMMKEEF